MHNFYNDNTYTDHLIASRNMKYNQKHAIHQFKKNGIKKR